MFNRASRPALPTVITELVLLCDICYGLAWLLGSPSRTAGPSFHIARLLLDPLPGDPMRWYGGILTLLGALALVAMTTLADHRARRWIAWLIPFWAFFTAMYISAIFTTNNASLGAPFGTLIILIGHVRPLLTVNLTERR